MCRNKTRCEDGTKLQWLKVKAFRFVKEEPGVIGYSYDHSGVFQSINTFGRGRQPKNTKLYAAYSCLQPISQAKHNDLVKLCRSGIIPVELHAWYENLPTAAGVHDCTHEPAVDDSASEEEGTT